MCEEQSLGQLVRAVFTAWNQAGIDFLVLRNHERLPEFTTNDIDVLVSSGQRERAARILISVAFTQGYRLINCAEFATMAVFLAHSESTAQAHFDLFTDIRWRGFQIISCEDFLRAKKTVGFFAIPHPAHEATSNLMGSFLYTGKVKEKYRKDIAAVFRSEPKATQDLLAKTYGASTARAIVSLASGARWSELEAMIGHLRRILIARQIALSPISSAKRLLLEVWRFLGRMVRPPGVAIAFCGVDGSGKSTCVEWLHTLLEPTFSRQKVKHFHWKPRVFSSTRTASSSTNPHSQPCRGRILSIVYFFLHWTEFSFGWFLRVYPILFRGGLVTLDRFYYDFFVDQLRYRLRLPTAVVRFGFQFLCKPHVAILLDAPPEVLQNRKQELPSAETERQRLAFLALFRDLPNGTVIDASQPPEKVATDTARVIMDFMACRANSRIGKLH